MLGIEATVVSNGHILAQGAYGLVGMVGIVQVKTTAYHTWHGSEDKYRARTHSSA